jgi:hypothetical protein
MRYAKYVKFHMKFRVIAKANDGNKWAGETLIVKRQSGCFPLFSTFSFNNIAVTAIFFRPAQ